MVKTINRKGQLKIQQTAFMLLAVTLFFVLVGLAFLSFQLANVKKEFVSLQEENAKRIVASLANSPEFACPQNRPACIDFDKAMSLKDNVNYDGFWQADSIIIREIYPEKKKEILCNKVNYPSCNKIIVQEKKGKDLVPQHSSFVQLCRRESSQSGGGEYCTLGVLTVGFEA